MPMGGVELLIILAIILLLFGAKRVPQLGRSMGQGFKEFKEGFASKEDALEERADTKAVHEEPEKNQRAAHAEASRANGAPSPRHKSSTDG